MGDAKMKKYNKKLGVYEKEGGAKLRIWHRKKKGVGSARYLIKCGDCDQSIEVYYDKSHDNFLEIGGVHATKKEWRKILLPLLKDIKKKKINEKKKRT